MRITHQDGVARRAFFRRDRPAVRTDGGVITSNRDAVRTAGGKAARHCIGGDNAACLPGRDQRREIVLMRHEGKMDNVLNTGSDVSGDEGPYPKERWVDRSTVAFDIFVLPFYKGLDDSGLLVAAGI
jgi:hypothetical protein